MDWNYFGNLMTQVNRGFAQAFILYGFVGATTILLRLVLTRHYGATISPSRDKFDLDNINNHRPVQRYFDIRFTISLLFVLIVTAMLPPNPWRRMTATLGYDVVCSLSTVILSKPVYGGSECSTVAALGSHFDNFNYNPADDPYYVSNLDQPIDDFFIAALSDAKFTNIVHITLESMRDDSFPYREDGFFHKHILNNIEPAEGGLPITTETITPFIASLAENTISWESMWATVAKTHKTMLACKMLLPIG
jgi:hypothetical protein